MSSTGNAYFTTCGVKPMTFDGHVCGNSYVNIDLCCSLFESSDQWICQRLKKTLKVGLV
jgi:hypothetical protein